MAAAYVDDAGFLARVPAVFSTALTVNQRSVALDDAEEFVALDVASGKSELAHAMYAAHLLLCRFPSELAAVGGGTSGPVQSKSAGEISVTYAVTAASEADPSTTPFGKRYMEIMSYCPYPFIAV